MQSSSFRLFFLLLAVGASTAAADDEAALFARARQSGQRFEQLVAASRRVLLAWLEYADPRTSLLPERLPGLRGLKPEDTTRLFTPHNSGADLYPYLILTAHLTDPEIYHGLMMEMLCNGPQ